MIDKHPINTFVSIDIGAFLHRTRHRKVVPTGIVLEIVDAIAAVDGTPIRRELVDAGCQHHIRLCQPGDILCADGECTLLAQGRRDVVDRVMHQVFGYIGRLLRNLCRWLFRGGYRRCGSRCGGNRDCRGLFRRCSCGSGTWATLTARYPACTIPTPKPP